MDAQAVQSALASADSFTLTVGEGMLADRAGQYLSKIELRYASIDPVTSGATLGIELTGKADWYDDHVAAQTFEQKGAFDTRIPSSQKAVLRVERPAAELHTYVQYATADDGTECEDPNYTNRGGSGRQHAHPSCGALRPRLHYVGHRAKRAQRVGARRPGCCADYAVEVRDWALNKRMVPRWTRGRAST